MHKHMNNRIVIIFISHKKILAQSFFEKHDNKTALSSVYAISSLNIQLMDTDQPFFDCS